jgi:hypothetical protein
MPLHFGNIAQKIDMGDPKLTGCVEAEAPAPIALAEFG